MCCEFWSGKQFVHVQIHEAYCGRNDALQLMLNALQRFGDHVISRRTSGPKKLRIHDKRTRRRTYREKLPTRKHREELAADLCRPFHAIARLEQEKRRTEDFGVDYVGTLLHQSSCVMIAEQACIIQVKISSFTRFEFRGEGISWLRQLVLPYSPLVVDWETSSASLFTLNDWHRVIFPSLVDGYAICSSR